MTGGREGKPGTPEQQAEVLLITMYRNVYNKCAWHRPTVRNCGLWNYFQFEL